MTSATPLDPVLLRQLKKAGLLEPSALPTAEVWTKLLAAVNDYYRHMNEDRALLTRSMDLSTSEMDELRQRVEAQRDQLSGIVDTIGDALGPDASASAATSTGQPSRSRASAYGATATSRTA